MITEREHLITVIQGLMKRVEELEQPSSATKAQPEEVTMLDVILESQKRKGEIFQLKEKLEVEKQRRIYYQDIVYKVCNLLEPHCIRKLFCGSLETPSTEVQDALLELLPTGATRQATHAVPP